MKRTVTLLLVCAAAGIYSYNGWLLFSFFLGEPSSETLQSKASPATAHMGTEPAVEAFSRPVRFVPHKKSPFSATLPRPAPAPKPKKRSVRPAEKKQVDPPALTVTGIMWNASNPMAMVSLPGGGGVVVKEGQVLAGDLKVTKIERRRVGIEKEGRVFWVER